MLKITRPPDHVIGPTDDPYMERWYIIPRNKWFNIYLHKISRSDEDRALHDHRADNLSIVLRGSYTEILARKLKYKTSMDWALLLRGEQLNGWAVGDPTTVIRKRGAIVFRRADQPHRLVVDGDPVWTLWFKFGDRRDWGFYPKIDGQYHWMQWEEFERLYADELWK